MSKATKKQPAKKKLGRPAKKAPRKKSQLKEITLSNYEIVPMKATSKDTEVESLAAICSMFDNWNEEQKRRNLKYLCGRYYDFL